MNIFETLAGYFQFPFVRYALIAGVLIALCSSLLGVTLVLKRFSFIGDGLSHVAFGAMAIATVVNVSNDMLIVMPVTILSAILLLRKNGTKNVRGDAALAMISVGALAVASGSIEVSARRLLRGWRHGFSIRIGRRMQYIESCARCLNRHTNHWVKYRTGWLCFEKALNKGGIL